MNPFEQILRKLILAEIETLKENLALGLAIQTVEQYKETVGKISGLRVSLELCQTTMDELEKR